MTWHMEKNDPEAELQRAFDCARRIFREAVAGSAALKEDRAIMDDPLHQRCHCARCEAHRREKRDREALLSVLAGGNAVDIAGSEGDGLGGRRQTQRQPPKQWERTTPYKPVPHSAPIRKRLAQLEERVQRLEGRAPWGVATGVPDAIAALHKRLTELEESVSIAFTEASYRDMSHHGTSDRVIGGNTGINPSTHLPYGEACGGTCNLSFSPLDVEFAEWESLSDEALALTDAKPS